MLSFSQAINDIYILNEIAENEKIKSKIMLQHDSSGGSSGNLIMMKIRFKAWLMKSEANTDRIKLAAISLIPANPVIKAMQHFQIK